MGRRVMAMMVFACHLSRAGAGAGARRPTRSGLLAFAELRHTARAPSLCPTLSDSTRRPLRMFERPPAWARARPPPALFVARRAGVSTAATASSSEPPPPPPPLIEPELLAAALAYDLETTGGGIRQLLSSGKASQSVRAMSYLGTTSRRPASSRAISCRSRWSAPTRRARSRRSSCGARATPRTGRPPCLTPSRSAPTRPEHRAPFDSRA